MRVRFLTGDKKSSSARNKLSTKEEFFKAYNSASLALKASDTKVFYEHARIAIAKKLELASSKKIDQALHNIDEIIDELGLDDKMKMWLKKFLSESEMIVFSNHRPPANQMEEMAKEFDRFINNFGK
jgi:adenosine deaminase